MQLTLLFAENALLALERNQSRGAELQHCGDVQAGMICKCGRSTADAHHLRFAQPRAMGRKVSDEFTVPLLSNSARDNHRFGDRFGDEVAWGEKGY